MTPSPSALLFDLDGVLVDSREVWFRVVEQAGQRFGSGPVARAAFEPTFGQGTEADIRCFGLRCSVAELDAFYARAFLEHLDQMWVDPQAAEVLAALRRSERGLAVATNSTTPLAGRILEKAGLRSFFSTVACADQVGKAKPAPDLLLHACQQLGELPSRCWMVGDSSYDRGAARAAGIAFLGLRLDGDRRIEQLGELLPLLGL